MLDPSSALPLYRQLASELEQRIRRGRLAVGERIPSEHELAERFGLGRPTVRQATELLVRRGLLIRRRGSGTYVAPVEEQVDLFTLGGTLAAFKGAGLALETRLLAKPQLVELELAEHPLNGQLVVLVERLGSLAGEPVLLERLWLKAELFPGLAEHVVQGESLSALIERVYQRRASGGKQRLQVACLATHEAQCLGLPSGAPVLLVERQLDFPGAAAAVVAHLFCRTERVALVQSLSAASPAPAP